MKHTKGEWYYCGIYPGFPASHVIAVNEHRILMVVDNTNNEIEAKANAKLIVAAPDLLESLKELVECDYTSGTHLYTATIKAKLAIKKATQ